jgi:TolA-binding protein
MYLKNGNCPMAAKNYETAVKLNPQNKKAAKILEELMGEGVSK